MIGYTVGVLGVIVFVPFLFVELRQGPYSFHTAVSYLLGNPLAREAFYEQTVRLLGFVGIIHATKHRRVGYCVALAALLQLRHRGVVVVPTHRIVSQHPLSTPAVETPLTLPLVPDSVLRALLWIGRYTEQPLVVPVGPLVALVGTLFAVAATRDSGRSLRGVRSTLVARIEGVAYRESSDQWSSRWRLLSQAVGFTVVAVGVFLTTTWVVAVDTAVAYPLPYEYRVPLGLAVLSMLVFEAHRTESALLIGLLAATATVTGLAGLEYGLYSSRATLSVGVLLFVSVLATVISRRNASPSTEDDTQTQY
ncbi:MAG: hypothetical protein ABEH80_05060 [Halobaculum sp.]